MPLSEDLADLEAYVALAHAGLVDLDLSALREMRVVIGGLAERAGVLERTLSQHWPSRDPGVRAARDAAIASGKVAVLAAYRLDRLAICEPGWLA